MSGPPWLPVDTPYPRDTPRPSSPALNTLRRRGCSNAGPYVALSSILMPHAHAHAPRCVRRPPPWRRACKTVLVQHLRHARAHRAGRIPILASRHSNFEGPRTTFRIQRGGCWIATVIDSSTTEGGYMAKPWAALPVSGSVILGSWVLRCWLFEPPSGWLAAGEGGERMSNFSKPAALRGPRIAFGLTYTTPSAVRSTPGTTGRGAPLP